jgi:hypothetical protein
MRKMFSSDSTSWRVALRARAEARSRPKGFSTMTRAFAVTPTAWSCFTTVGNMLGGMAR